MAAPGARATTRLASRKLFAGSKTSAGVVACFVAVMCLPVRGVALGQDKAQHPAVPVEPIAAILALDAFGTHQLIALSEGGHGNEQTHAFRLALIRDPRFAATVDDIVVEFGNSLYQGVMDSFIRGEDVDRDVLRQVWENTTQPNAVWDRLIYEEFFRAVREVNASLSKERQLRVLLGDPPVEWSNGQPSIPATERDSFAADLIRREVLAKQRRALILYGGAHLWRVRTSRLNLLELLEQGSATRVFNILTGPANPDPQSLQPDVTNWPVPSLALIRGTPLDTGRLVYWDAVLYLGPPSSFTVSQLPPALCADRRYMEMRLRRLATTPFALRDFTADCARAASAP